MREIDTKTITEKQNLISYFKEIWNAKELLLILAKRDITVKYKQTTLGVAWSLIRPLITTFVMVFAFGKIGNLAAGVSIPFVLVVIPGIIAWFFFSQALQAISQSILFNANLVTKVFFPRLILPISTVGLALIDVAVSILIYVGLCVYYQFIPDYKLIFFPLFLLLSFLIAFGVGLIAAVLYVKFRDIGQIIPFIIQFGYYLSPVGYLTENVKKLDNPLYYKLFIINPLTGIIDAMRWCMLGNYAAFNWESFIPSLMFIALSLVFSVYYFRKHENSFVDFI